MEKIKTLRLLRLFASIAFSAGVCLGAGNPILVVGTSANQFSFYYSEILKAEGVNAFDTADISSITASVLSAYDLVLLGEVPLTAAQVTTFTNWVNAGGNLIAMRPDKQLAGLLGIVSTSGTLSNGYLVTNTAKAPGAGIVGQAIQFHGIADIYSLSGATTVATLYSSATIATSNPAVTVRTGIGSGGNAAAFTYDLAKSVVYTRQGNPAWAGQARDGLSPIRSDDLFFGNASFDPQPDWIDRNNISIPQADEQQRLLANIILFLNQNKKPLPRFWYLPFGKKAAIIMTGDDHANGGTAGRFDAFIAASPTGCNVANWECVRGTSYLFIGGPLTDSQAASYTAQGFEVSVHVTPALPPSNSNCADWSPSDLDSFYASQLSSWTTLYHSEPAPATHRLHCVAWDDWVTQPQVELAHGIRLDTTYYFYPPSWVTTTPGLFTGSGMPMRFANTDGTIIDVYQAPTQMTDESGQSYPATINGLLDNAVGSAGFYGAFTVQMHTDSSTGTSQSTALQIVSAAQSRGVPVVSAKQMLQWLDGRNGSSFGALSWSGNVLSFTVTAATGSTGLQAMLPVNTPSGGLSTITQNGTAVSYTVQTIKGVQYAFFSAPTGTYRATYGGISVTVSPTTATLYASQTQQFTAAVVGTGNTGVSWSSSNPGLGTLSASGLYTAPTSNATNQTLTVTATSAADLSKSGSATVTLLSDSTPTTISGIMLNPSSTSATISWTTDKKTNSRIDYGVSPTSLTLNVSDPTLVTSHSLTLTGLTMATTYYYRITSADASSTSTSPPSTSSPATFATVDLTLPTISALTATAGSGGTAVVTWTTNKAASSRVDYGTSSTSLTQSVTDASLLTSHSLTLTGLALGSTYYYRATSVDSLGNAIVSPATTGSPASFVENVVSIWSPTSSPVVVDSADGSGVEVGVRFRSDVAGVVTGVRFYKTTANTGTHVGNLWSNAGTLLGSVTFTNESPTGWQQANFSSPIAITANTTYVVSYYAPVGHYSVNTSAFASAGVDNAPLHALRDGLDGANGVFRYGSASAFPNQSFNSGNYWVDLSFTDNIPPVISAVAVAASGTSATITWTTDTPSTSRVDYGTSQGSLNLNVSDSTATTAHSLTLTGLTLGTTYYYRVTSADAFGNSATSPVLTGQPASFVAANTTPPVISGLTATPGSTSATITWSTDKNASSRIDYGTSATSLTLNATNASLVTAHSLTLSGLAVGTTYYYRVTSVDSSGNSATLPVATDPAASFITLDPNPPVISSVVAIPGTSGSAVVSWTTNKSATSRVDYGTSQSSLSLNVSNASLVTAHTLTLTGLTQGTTYYYRVTSVDASGNSTTSPVATNAPASFVENVASVWSSSTVPTVVDSGDGSGVELGMRFRSDLAGVVTGVRFYKATTNTGSHIGNLWTNTGTNLGTVTFTGETASGWQQANFAAPVAIAANTTYVVSYYAPLGHYSYTVNGFTTAVDNPPLHALADGTDGANGVYRYAASTGFPNLTYSSENYWVDVVFADNVAPTISGVGATTTASSATITWTTNEASNSRVDYGTSPTALTLNASSAAMVTSHSIAITGLTAGTTYYYRVTSADPSGNSTTSPVTGNSPATFVAVDTTPPVISAVTATPATTSATITWTTDENSTSRVDYGTSATTLNLNASSGTLVTSHSLTLSGLTAGITYYFRVTSVDGSGNSATSPATGNAAANFTTVSTNPPVISAVTATAGAGGAASITWTTDKLSTSRVDYGTTATSLTLNVSNATLVTSHSLSLTGLTSGATYYYRVTSVDGGGNSATSPPTGNSAASFVENAGVSVWSSSTVPPVVDSGDGSGVELGMRFRADVSGSITGVRFYKASTNTGSHVGNLWTTTGTNLGTVTFTNETTSGWQQANLATPVAISANTTYIVSYYAPVGHYSMADKGFASAVDNAPLHALADGFDGSNGVYRYGSASGFPSQTYNSENYWVDIVFSPTAVSTPPTISSVTAMPGLSGSATITWTTDTLSNSSVVYGTSPSSLTSNASSATLVTAHSISLSGLVQGSTYYYRVTSVDGSGNSSTSPVTTNSPASFVENAVAVWSPSTVPAVVDANDGSAVELGVKFRSDTAGNVIGIRFYKSTNNTGSHLGHLWSSTGTLLATVTFTGESASGWQQAYFSAPVAITANTTYIVSYYAPVGHYSINGAYFSTGGADNAPLHALATGVDGPNGVYIYGASAFPNQSFNAANYWVDVIFH